MRTVLESRHNGPENVVSRLVKDRMRALLLEEDLKQLPTGS